MSLAAACGWTLLRSLTVALLTIPVCSYLRAELARLDRPRRLTLWALLMLPLLTPGLLPGYAYANFSLSLVDYPRWNEIRYALLIAAKLLAVGTAVMQFAPPAPVSREAFHSARLAMRPSWNWWRTISFIAPLWIRGSWRSAFPAFAIVFLLVFQEFDMASLLGTTSWTVWLFDAHADGLVLSESLRLSTIPTACELVVLTVIAALVVRSQLLVASPNRAARSLPFAARAALWLVAISGCIAVFGIPLALIGRDTVQGAAMMIRNRALVREIAIAGGFGIVSGVSASLLAGGILWRLSVASTTNGKRFAAALAAIALLPGLLGSLIVSLAALGLFQTNLLRAVYNTPVPAVVSLVAFLLPRAALLQLMLHAAQPRYGMHLANLLLDSQNAYQRQAGRQFDWVLHRRGQFLAACMICLWGYWELTPVAVLAPPGMTSAPVRLFSFMHYTRNDVLSAMTLTAMLAPVILIALVMALRWFAFRLWLFRRD